MRTSYDADVAAWASEQAALLRAGQFDAIDALHIADEIKDVARSAKCELGSELIALIAQLLQWKYLPGGQCGSWELGIDVQRRAIRYLLDTTPSLKRYFDDEEWMELLWMRGALAIVRESGLDIPEQWLWSLSQVLDDGFLPD
ncbi:DUF29 domain-containing protein [Massilia terrae]|uniref:DUF29 domain-containing protein n=1 Tax=Massilia terrae TaxID=1811224 RepID=A0ABT2D4J3_9BURK|nr:DUF29 domain-containing protein [Massilia terrae]MCS0661147.1 DUF29 domain-containing protein [Massilia terrae]